MESQGFCWLCGRGSEPSCLSMRSADTAATQSSLPVLNSNTSCGAVSCLVQNLVAKSPSSQNSLIYPSSSCIFIAGQVVISSRMAILFGTRPFWPYRLLFFCKSKGLARMAIHAVLTCIQPVHIPCPFQVPFLPHHTHCYVTLVADSVVQQNKQTRPLSKPSGRTV